MSVLSKPYMHNEEAAFAYVEAMFWGEGQWKKDDPKDEI